MGDLPRLVLTGASGFVGRYALRALTPRYRVIAVDRQSRSESVVPARLDVEWHQVDLADGARVAALFRLLAAEGGAEAVIHLAGYYDFEGEDHPEYRRTNVDGLRHVLEGSKGLGLRRFVFASSLAACDFPPPGGALTEASPPDGDHAYARSKRAGEEMLAEYAADFPSAIVRFAALFSDWCQYPPLYYFLETWLSRRWNAHMLGGRGESAVPYLHVRDAAMFLLAVLQRADDLAPGEVLLASPDGAVSHRELFEAAVAEYFDGRAPRPRFVPRLLCRPGMWLRDAVGRRLGSRPFERPWMASYVDLRLTADAHRTRERLGWAPRERLAILRRVPFMIENLRTDPVEWHRRNQEMMELRRFRPNLQIYQLLKERETEIRDLFEERLAQPETVARRPHYQNVPAEDLEWSHRVLLRNLLNSVRTRRRDPFVAYCRDLAERRAEQGFDAAELILALDTLGRTCLQVLAGLPEVQGLEDDVHDLVAGTVQFAIDRVEELYEAVRGEAIELPPSVELFPPRPAGGRTSRRKALQVLGTLAGYAWLGLNGVTGCGGPPAAEEDAAPEEPAELRVPLDSLPPGEHVRVHVGKIPVELRRMDGTVVARSLVCTHFGCEVRWNGERKEYFCPCHGGIYDAQGKPIAGPPDFPLHLLKAQVEGDSVVVTE